MDNSAVIHPQLLNEAAEWLVQMQSGVATAEDHEALRRWCERSEQHRQAWQRAEAMLHDLKQLPSGLAQETLGRRRQLGRRRVLRGMLTVTVAGTTGWVLREQQSADLRTSVGQHQAIVLPDGSALTLGTATAVDLKFGDRSRQLSLRSGELMVTVAADPMRPFRVTTRHGSIQSLGTRFSVREDDGATRVAVVEHAVSVQPESQQSGGALILRAGEQTTFTKRAIAAVQPADSTTFAWTKGMLIVDEWRLQDVLDELARYRPGIIRCAQDVADLRISGIFSLLDTQSSLNLLAASFPLTVRSLSRYWVMVEARG
ncbi:FecR domain-containing protein [Steroidobacter sp.]|uniref:FecR domain-containing protein n=1 Tax=Steroidobacter sp. TaxID=1978227 RepID=UPI001A47F9FD|nr:FecR domain-containing protein [Steroidobacter sp.]MBL8266021.1 FecR domain-containing protein [Steroidobacter sp.]